MLRFGRPLLKSFTSCRLPASSLTFGVGNSTVHLLVEKHHAIQYPRRLSTLAAVHLILGSWHVSKPQATADVPARHTHWWVDQD